MHCVSSMQISKTIKVTVAYDLIICFVHLQYYQSTVLYALPPNLNVFSLLVILEQACKGPL